MRHDGNARTGSRSLGPVAVRIAAVVDLLRCRSSNPIRGQDAPAFPDALLQVQLSELGVVPDLHLHPEAPDMDASGTGHGGHVRHPQRCEQPRLQIIQQVLPGRPVQEADSM